MLDDFYRDQRRRFGVLMDPAGKPEGGPSSFDAENRKPPTRDLPAPVPWQPEEDAMDAFRPPGSGFAARAAAVGADGPRAFAVTPAEAALALDSFCAGTAPLAAVEGFVRQIIAWREYFGGM